jgi:hypothetical protein
MESPLIVRVSTRLRISPPANIPISIPGASSGGTAKPPSLMFTVFMPVAAAKRRGSLPSPSAEARTAIAHSPSAARARP